MIARDGTPVRLLVTVGASTNGRPARVAWKIKPEGTPLQTAGGASG
jgi:hypothetical protein